jgi:hypothetical protein
MCLLLRNHSHSRLGYCRAGREYVAAEANDAYEFTCHAGSVVT